jgi:hypothetical protein|nr:MAG TPA: Protein of unknown function (DUF2577) [Bacteriophage sp.]
MADNNGSLTSLKGIFQGMIPADAELMQGTVISASPLKIQMANDEKLIVNERITVVPRHLTDYTTTCSFTKGAKGAVYGPDTRGDTMTNPTFSGSITMYNALKTGDKVYVLSLNNGKLYYVLDRVVA